MEGGWGKLVLFLLLSLSVHIIVQYKLRSPTILFIVIFYLFFSITLLIFSDRHSYFSTYSQNFTKTTKIKPNQTLFDRTYFFIQKHQSILIKKSKYLSFITKVNPNNGKETKSDIFPWTYSNLTTYLFYQKILKYFNDFQNRNFSVL